MNNDVLLDTMVNIFNQEQDTDAAKTLVENFFNALEKGHIRVAYKNNNVWQVDERVKKAILLSFRLGKNIEISSEAPFSFIDKENLMPRSFSLADKARVVPGGTTIRRGAFIGTNVIIMPPSYVNVGAFIDASSMLDSNALVGSCAQVGKRVHISAGAQIGGVLEPIGATPVIIEDDCVIGGNAGIFEGTQIGKEAVIAAGVNLTKSSKVFDLVNNKIISATDEEPLKIPNKAVVISGARGLNSGFALEHKLSISTPLIIKYKDQVTQQKTKLEDALR